MSYGFILGVLTVLSLIIGSASTLWGMSKKTTFEDPQGQKRLTPAGHIAVALALGSFVTAVAMFGLKTISDQQSAEAKRAEASRMQETIEAGAFRQEQRDRRAEQDRRIAKAEQELLIASTANEQRKRDETLARDVNRGTRQNLERTKQTLIRSEAALAQLQRVLNPIRDISVEVTWCIPGKTPGLANEAKPLSDYARSMPGFLDRGIAGGFRPDVRLDIDVNSPVHPAAEPRAMPLILRAINSGGFIQFYRAGVERRSLESVDDGDIDFPLSPATHSILSLITKEGRGDIFFSSHTVPSSSTIRMTGKILSLKDLKGAFIKISKYDGRIRTSESNDIISDAVIPVSVRIGMSNRAINIPFYRFERLSANSFLAAIKLEDKSELHQWKCEIRG